MLRMMSRALFHPQISTGYANSVVKCPFQIRCYSQPKQNIEDWVNTLDEAQQKRIRYIQNEVKLSESFINGIKRKVAKIKETNETISTVLPLFSFSWHCKMLRIIKRQSWKCCRNRIMN